MFRRKVKNLDDIMNTLLREQGLETPLLQRRVLDAWDEVVGPTISGMTADKFISNQTMMVKITNPALRNDLSMMRTEILSKLNSHVGQIVIYDLKIF